MQSMKHRISNVLAWLGVIYPTLFCLFGLIKLMGYDSLAQDLFEAFFPLQSTTGVYFVLFGLYPCCAIVNYLLVGRFRLLPWKKITEDS
jgi:hypothetical protein